MTAPVVEDQCTDPGTGKTNVTWTEVGANAAVGGVTVTCSNDGDGTDLRPTSGVFGVGNHTVTCRGVTVDGCHVTKTFSFSVLGG